MDCGKVYIDQMLSCCFLPHYQMTQKTVFGQAAHKDPSQLHNTLLISYHVGWLSGVYTYFDLWFTLCSVHYEQWTVQIFFINALQSEKNVTQMYTHATNFAPLKHFSSRKISTNVFIYVLYALKDWRLDCISLGECHTLSVSLSSARVFSSAPWTRWRTSKGVSLFLFLALRPLRRTSSLSRSTSSTYSTFRVRSPISLSKVSFSHEEPVLILKDILPNFVWVPHF